MDKKSRYMADYISLEYKDAFEIMMKSTADLIYFKDKESRFIYSSDSHLKRCLNESDIKNVIGKSDFDYFNKKHATEAYQCEQQIMKTGIPILNAEEHETFASGETLWYKVSRYPLYDKDKNIVGTWGISTDITNQKNAEFQIKEREERYQTLSEITIEGIVVHDNGIIKDLNSSFLKLLGYEHEEMLEHDLFEFIYCDDRPIARKHILMDYTSPYEIRFIKKSGESFYTEIQGKTIQTHGTEIRMAAIRDITERKQAEDALHDSEIRMRSISDSAYDAILMMDQNSEITYWNPAAERIFGYTSTEAIGQNLIKLIIPSNYRKTYHAAYLGLQQKEGGRTAGEILCIEASRKDKKKIHVQLSLSTVEISSGMYSVGIIRDVTEQKKSEAELLKAKEVAEEATKAKSEFLANMSHEIRTPMNAVIGFSGLIKKTELSQKQTDYVAKIDSAAKSLHGIINDILDFSKIEAGKLELEKVEFRLDDVVNDTMSMLSDKAAEKNIELINSISSNVPYALIGDPLRIGQILVNLVNNAVKFTEKGHVLVKTELVKKDDVSCQIKFSVNDTGIGLTEAQKAKLFTAFSQADTSVTRRFGGTGLGLTISKRLVEMMKGRILVESEFGVGSTFSFVIDFIMQAKEKNKKQFDSDKLRNIKVLIVDDNEMSREVLKEQLESFRISAMAVASGQAAILELQKEAKGKPYDLVIMDWRMPEFDGIRVARMINDNENIEHKPRIILVSAYGREEIAKRAEKIGINTFLMKPINQSLLFDSIMNMFGIDKSDASVQRSEREKELNAIDRVDGINVLLVEDNEINQEVAKEILSSAGAMVDIANNGKEAIAAVKEKNYDVVLMDLQMPVMGGYEATKEIRKQIQFEELPIIAMTAHAMQGVKAECLAAGMNDYVSKPIDPKNLFSTIKKWVGKAVDEGMIQLGKQSDNGIVGEGIIQLPANIPGFDLNAGLNRLNGNKKLYKKLLVNFSREYSSIPSNIKKSVDKRKFEEASRLAHALKGVAGNVSAQEIQNIAAELELLLSNNDIEKCDELLENLVNSFDSLNKLLSELDIDIKVDKQKVDRPIDLSEVEPILRELALFVWEDNVDAEKPLDELQKLIGESNHYKELKELAKHIGDFDFEMAKKPLNELAKKMKIDLGGGRNV
ncbi:MAG: response regulator [Clostridiales bacterium]|nr:response regulator [Clostridiales bacterium]